MSLDEHLKENSFPKVFHKLMANNMKYLFLTVILYTVGLIKGYCEEVSASGTLPILYINVYTDAHKDSFNNEIINKDLAHKNYFSYAEYWLDLNGCEWLESEGAESIGTKDSPLPLEIKARGNYTRIRFSKKPFKLKLKEKQGLLGLSKSKHFALLAHADDCYGYLRNFIGFNLGKRIGLPWTPSQQPVEVVINGDYRGLYFLTESVRVDEERINIAELKDNESDPNLISGGYVVEIDNTVEDNQLVLEQKSCVEGHLMKELRISWEEPEEYSALQLRFITDQFSAINDAVGEGSDILWGYIDLDDAARYYLVREIMCDTEAYSGSTYLFRDRGEGQKWHFSPIWDCGQAFLGKTDEFFYDVDTHGNVWIPSIRTNSSFNSKVTETWLWFMNTQYDGLYEDVQTYVEHIQEAAIADAERWIGKPTPEDGREVFNNSDMTGRQEIVLRILSRKINWLKTQFGDFEKYNVISEPERDMTPAISLPEYLTSDVNEYPMPGYTKIPIYYNLQGIRIDTPKKGNMYLRKQGIGTDKVIY